MDHLQNFNRRLVWTLMFALSSFNVYAASADPLPRATPNKLGFSASALQRIDQFYLDEISRDRIPGAVIAIARKGQLAYYKPIGFQQKATGTAMPIDALFNLASMTKVLTVATALTLYEQGRLPLKSTLSQYDPQFAQMRVGIVDANGTVDRKSVV